jgi:uncharacterized protein YcbK (DUF882 family)
MSKPTVSFEEWFSGLKVKHFTAGEFTSYFRRTRGGVRNSPPPVTLRPNIVPTIRIVDDLRRHFKKPIVLLSSYRSPAYNRAVGGAPKSIHMEFRALDIAVAGVAPSEVFKVLRSWRAAGKFKGGLGLYETFVHIDTRGYDATW